MRFFTKVKHIVPVTPEPSLQDRAQAAEQDVIRANERANAAAKAVFDLQCKHNLTLDNFGRITACSAIGGATEDDLPQQVRALVEARSLAMQKFHAALNVWAGLKGALENATNNR